MRARTRTAVAAAAVASVIGGGVAGAVLAGPATAVAQQTDAEDLVAVDDHQTVEDVLADLVEEQVITQEQADTIGERLRAAHAGGGPHEHFGRGPHLGAGLDDVAGVLGMSVADLAVALQDGASIADVAADRGVDVASVIAVLVENAQARLDAAVTDGKLTADEAAEELAEIESRVTDMVNGDLESIDRLGPSRRGFGERFDVDGDGAAGTAADA